MNFESNLMAAGDKSHKHCSAGKDEVPPHADADDAFFVIVALTGLWTITPLVCASSAFKSEGL